MRAQEVNVGETIGGVGNDHVGYGGGKIRRGICTVVFNITEVQVRTS